MFCFAQRAARILEMGGSDLEVGVHCPLESSRGSLRPHIALNRPASRNAADARAAFSPRERVRCVLGTFGSLEVKGRRPWVTSESG
jgi:hypothetical protein